MYSNTEVNLLIYANINYNALWGVIRSPEGKNYWEGFWSWEPFKIYPEVVVEDSYEVH